MGRKLLKHNIKSISHAWAEACADNICLILAALILYSREKRNHKTRTAKFKCQDNQHIKDRKYSLSQCHLIRTKGAYRPVSLVCNAPEDERDTTPELKTTVTSKKDLEQRK